MAEGLGIGASVWQISIMKRLKNILSKPLLFGIILTTVLAGCASAPAESVTPDEPLQITISETRPTVRYEPSRAYDGNYHITWSLDPNPEYPPREQDQVVTRSADQRLEYGATGFDGAGFYYIRVAAEENGTIVYSNELRVYLAGGDL